MANRKYTFEIDDISVVERDPVDWSDLADQVYSAFGKGCHLVIRVSGDMPPSQQASHVRRNLQPYMTASFVVSGPKDGRLEIRLRKIADRAEAPQVSEAPQTERGAEVDA